MDNHNHEHHGHANGQVPELERFGDWADSRGIPPDAYLIGGEHREGHCAMPIGGNTWAVFFMERGRRVDERHVEGMSAALALLKQRLLDDPGYVGDTREAAVTSMVRDEERDAWCIPVSDDATFVTIDYALTVQTTGNISVRIEERFCFVDAHGSSHCADPNGDPTLMGPVLGVARTSVARILAWDDGRLRMDFADGSALEVPGGDAYEAWTLCGPDTLMIVSMPGGKLSLWGLPT